jgi:hypothetical protein
VVKIRKAGRVKLVEGTGVGASCASAQQHTPGAPAFRRCFVLPVA